MIIRLGSLFDGSGTCPLAAEMLGVEPVWASEIEKFPVAVTSKRFPYMKHLGDVTKINGAEIEPVDIITFGSPCQDLSICGKRAGLSGEKSSLFLEAIRIIKEMRDATNGIYPRFAVWENVYGAFSSQQGRDFKTVLEELWQISEPGVSIPGLEKWQHAGCIVGDHSSITWRGLDAQYWGVPQRRKRIFLVADFRGQRAGEVLFEREGLQRDTETIHRAEQTVTPPIEGSNRKYYSVENHPTDGRCKLIENNTVQTLTERMGTGGGNVPLVLQGSVIGRTAKNGPNGSGVNEGVSFTLNTIDVHAVTVNAFTQNSYSSYKESAVCGTLLHKGGAVGVGGGGRH